MHVAPDPEDLDENGDVITPQYQGPGHPNDGNEGNEGNEGDEGNEGNEGIDELHKTVIGTFNTIASPPCLRFQSSACGKLEQTNHTSQ